MPKPHLHLLGELPDEVITAIGKEIIYYLAIGISDVGGNGFGDIFAKAIGGKHYKKPEGVIDVGYDNCSDCAWSVKTIKKKNPFKSKTNTIRLISGRNSLDQSKIVTNQKIGNHVLKTWNDRVSDAQTKIKGDLRLVVLVRDMENLNFMIFEEKLHEYSPDNYTWTKNKRNNLEGYEKGKHKFTWQPHGSQFTIKHDISTIPTIPASVTHFTLDRPPRVDQEDILRKVGYEEKWITKVK